MRVLSALILAVLLALPAAAQGQAPPPSSALRGDDRLNKPVTVRWKKATLFEALAELKRQTGVSMVPDRAVVDEPIMAAARDMPARALMEHIAQLLRFTWTRYGGTQDKPAYLLFRDLNATREEQAEVDKAERAVTEALNQEIERLRRFGRMSEDQLQRELERADAELEKIFEGGLAAATNSQAASRRMMDNMAIRTAASPTGRAMMGVLDGLTPAQWGRLRQGQAIVMSTRPEAGELPMADSLRDQLSKSTPSFPIPKSLFQKVAGAGNAGEAFNQIETLMRNEWGKADGYKVTVSLNLNMGAQPMGMLRLSPEPLGVQEGIGMIFMASGVNVIAAPGLLDEPKEDPAEREKRLAADPFLAKKGKLKLPPLEKSDGLMQILGGGYRMADILAAVEDAYGVKLVADAYNRQAMSVVPPPADAEIPLFKILDQMAGMTREWERHGDVIRLKSKTWAHDRRCEIPARYMKRWVSVREKKGGLALDDLAEIASVLRDEQVENLMYSAMEEGVSEFTDFMMVTMNRDPLRFWARLLPLQKRSLLAGAKIPARSLYPQQQQALMQLSRPKQQSLFAGFMGSGKPPRAPQELAAAVIVMENTDVTARREQPEGPRREPQAMAAIAGAASGMYTLRVAFPNGQKDEYRIPIMRPTPRKPAQEAMPGAAPAAPEPPPVF
jgi:hypothetical protein